MLRRIIASICIVVSGLSPLYPQSSPAQIVEAGLAAATIGDFINNLKSVVKQVEDSAHSLIDHGNAALGQQEMVIAGILDQLIQKLSTTYVDALGKTFDQISQTERDTFQSIADSLNGIDKLEQKSNKDVQDKLYQLQISTNQVLDRLPFVAWSPVFYGMLVRDLTTDPSPNPADVTVLGFHFVDPKINSKNPIVKIADMVVPDGNISIREDRINVQLPDDIKKKIGFGSSPCDPRPTFPLNMTVFYGKTRGIWPISWTSEQSAQFSDNALAGANLYDVHITYDGTRTVTPLVGHSFSAKSGYTAMGCEQTTSASVRFDLPQGSQEISCSAAWVDTSNVGASSQNCTVGGTVATGSGVSVHIPPFSSIA